MTNDQARMDTPRFLYFDLGRVLVDFSHQQMFEQIGSKKGSELFVSATK